MTEQIPAEQSMALANMIMTEAGWRPIPKRCWAGGFVMARQVGGVAPDGTQYVKGLDIVRPGDPAYGPDTPDEHHEAAQWLVDHVDAKRAAAESAEHEAHSETGADSQSPGPAAEVGGEGAAQTDDVQRHLATGEEDREAYRRDVIAAVSVPEAPDASPVPESPPATEAVPEGADALSGGDGFAEEGAAEDLGSADAGSAGGGLQVYADDGHEGDGLGDPDYAFDADYEEVGEPAEVEDDSLGLGAIEDYSEPDALNTPEPDDPPHTGQDHFYGLDDLDRVKRLRIGDVAAVAAAKVAEIEAAVAEHQGEYAAIQAFVVSNLDKHTGAFTPQDEPSQKTYARFLELEEAKRRIGAIDTQRKAATAYLLDEARTRDEIVAFDPEEGWPL